MSLSPLSRLAGPFALTAGALMLVSQLVWLPFDTDDHQATSQNVVFQAGGVAYLIGFCMLMLALVAAYGWQAEKAGTFGLVAFLTAIVGTMLSPVTCGSKPMPSRGSLTHKLPKFSTKTPVH